MASHMFETSYRAVDAEWPALLRTLRPDAVVMFGLAKEYEKLGQFDKVIELLEPYLQNADDEGNAYGVLANAYLQHGDRGKAVETYKKGIDVSLAHGHPSMANEYRMTLEIDLAD